MKNTLICFGLTFFSIGYLSAQGNKTDRQEEFVETYRLDTKSVANPNLQLLFNRYYLETKNMILSEQEKLGKNDLNKMLIYNQKEFYTAIKNKFFKSNMSGEAAKNANELYIASIESNLSEYKTKVLDKLENILATNK